MNIPQPQFSSSIPAQPFLDAFNLPVRDGTCLSDKSLNIAQTQLVNPSRIYLYSKVYVHTQVYILCCKWGVANLLSSIITSRPQQRQQPQIGFVLVRRDLSIVVYLYVHGHTQYITCTYSYNLARSQQGTSSYLQLRKFSFNIHRIWGQRTFRATAI